MLRHATSWPTFARAVHRIGEQQNRAVHVTAESNLNDVRVVLPEQLGGLGLDAVWSDDFHHSLHALLTGERDGYYQDYGKPEQLVKAMNDVHVYDGCYSPFRRRRRGNKVGDTDRTRFIVAVQNHDQVGNRALGDRLTTLLPPAALRLAAALMLLSPFVPLLFMGEEYGETRPFPFFCSFGDPDLVDAIRKGRQREFADLAFQWHHEIPDAQDPSTFASAKLEWAWPEGSPQAERRQLYTTFSRRADNGRRSRPGQSLRAELVDRTIILHRGESPELIAYRQHLFWIQSRCNQRGKASCRFCCRPKMPAMAAAARQGIRQVDCILTKSWSLARMNGGYERRCFAEGCRRADGRRIAAR